MEIENDHIIWLEALYEDFKKGIQSDKRKLQIKLWDKLSKDFSPNEVHLVTMLCVVTYCFR